MCIDIFLMYIPKVSSKLMTLAIFTLLNDLTHIYIYIYPIYKNNIVELSIKNNIFDMNFMRH